MSRLLAKSRMARTTRVASLKPAYGILTSDSYINIPAAVAEWCKKSLIEASNRGVILSVLLKANDCSSAKPPNTHRKNKKRSRPSDLTLIGPRKRMKSSRYTFLPGPWKPFLHSIKVSLIFDPPRFVSALLFLHVRSSKEHWYQSNQSEINLSLQANAQCPLQIWFCHAFLQVKSSKEHWYQSNQSEINLSSGQCTVSS